VVVETYTPNVLMHIADKLKNLQVKFEMIGDYLVTRASGLPTLLVDLGEQLAWLGAACCASSLPDDLEYREAMASITLDDPTSLNILYRNHMLGPRGSESCWRSLFRNTCIASGFPVRKRCGSEPGLELDPEMMITLGQTDLITAFDGIFMLKGFSSVFVPMKRTKSSIYWHFVHTEKGSYIPYSTAHESCLGDDAFSGGDIRWMASLRHFVGWASDAEVCAGKFNIPTCSCP
jgi:hypothetical protein